MSSSSSGGGATSFFPSFLACYLGVSFFTSVAFGAEPPVAGAGPEEPICLVPSAISWWIGFPFTDSRSLLMSASSTLI